MKPLSLLALLLCVSACSKPHATAENVAPVPAATPRAAPSATPPLVASASGRGKPDASSCIVVDAENLSGERVTLEGTVFSGTRGHPNGSSFTFYGLTLAAPRCVVGLEETPSLTDVQIYMENDKPLAPYVGKKVRVTGDPFPEHTAWHTRPVVVTVRTIEKL